MRVDVCQTTGEKSRLERPSRDVRKSARGGEIACQLLAGAVARVAPTSVVCQTVCSMGVDDTLRPKLLRAIRKLREAIPHFRGWLIRATAQPCEVIDLARGVWVMVALLSQRLT